MCHTQRMERGREKYRVGDAISSWFEVLLNVAVLGSLAFVVIWFTVEGLRLFVFN